MYAWKYVPRNVCIHNLARKNLCCLPIMARQLNAHRINAIPAGALLLVLLLVSLSLMLCAHIALNRPQEDSKRSIDQLFILSVNVMIANVFFVQLFILGVILLQQTQGQAE